jgi:hypothetical protein
VIKFLDSKNKIVGLGLSTANLERLKQDDPILVHLADLGIQSDLTILIFWGESEEKMHARFMREGLIGPETEIKIDQKTH